MKKEKLQRCRELPGVLPQEQEKAAVNRSGTVGIDDAPVENVHKWFCPICKKGRLVPYLEIPRPYHRNIERAAMA